MTSPRVRGPAALAIALPVAGVVLVDALTGPTVVLLALVAATAYLAAELGRRYLNYLLAKQAVRRCDPARLPELVAAVTGSDPAPGTRPPNGGQIMHVQRDHEH